MIYEDPTVNVDIQTGIQGQEHRERERVFGARRLSKEARTLCQKAYVPQQ